MLSSHKLRVRAAAGYKPNPTTSWSARGSTLEPNVESLPP